MTAYINKLKDKDGNQQLPITHERAVRDDNGTTAETKFQNLEGAMDKAYVANSDNGMGRITLKKNMVSGVNTLTQSMMQATNTIYVICYDFTLGENITVPENCVLEFDGGSISGAYSLINVGKIINVSGSVIFKSVTFVNPLKQYVQLRWFDYNSVGDSLMAAAKFQIVDAVGTWNIDKDVEIQNNIELFNGTFNCRNGYEVYNFKIISTDISEKISYNNTIAKNARSINIGITGNYKYCLLQASNYYFKDSNKNGIVGEMMTIEELTEQNTNFGMCKTVCSYDSNVTVQYFNTINVNIHNCKFIAEYNETEHEGNLLVLEYCTGSVKDCYFTGCSTGLAVGNSYSVIVSSCAFENIYPWAIGFSEATFNSIVTNCTFKKHRHAWTTLGETYVAKYNIISNCNISITNIPITSHANAYGTLIEGNYIHDCDGGVGSYSPNCTVKGNKIENSTESRAPVIYFIEAGAINCCIKDNIIENIAGYSDGINVSGDFTDVVYNTTPERVVISGNIIKNCTSGNGIVYDPIFPNSTTQPGFITIKNNIIENFGYVGIYCLGFIAIIENNIVRNAQRSLSGISVKRGDSYPFANSICTVKGNVLYSCGSVSGNKAAIVLTNFESNEVSFNTKIGGGVLYEKVGNGSVTGNTPQSVIDAPITGDMIFINGAPQWWNGTAWVDATGTTV